MAVQPIPAGYQPLVPYLIVHDPAAAVDYYTKAFGGTIVDKLTAPDGTIVHAEIRIFGQVIMFSGEPTPMGFKSPLSYGGTPISLMIYVPDVDTAFAAALKVGGTESKPLADQFYGDRSGTLTDPFGHVWTLATHIEDVSSAEMHARMQKMFGG